MDRIIDFILCCGVTGLEVIGIMLIMLFIQGFCYRVIGINPIMGVIKWLDKCNRKMSMYFYGYER